jgi:uncharacterized damage-inducible protein DinB
MDKNYFLALAKYNIWANNKMISWLLDITESQFEQLIVSSFNNIRGNTLHIVSAEKIWLERVEGIKNSSWFENEFNGNRNELLAIWQQISEKLKLFIENFEESNIYKTIKFTRMNGEENELPYYQILSHVLNHTTFHRGQFVILLRQVGYTNISGTDLLDFYNL